MNYFFHVFYEVQFILVSFGHKDTEKLCKIRYKYHFRVGFRYLFISLSAKGCRL